MEIYEITGFQSGISREGVNFLQPSDSFQNIKNGYIYRQVLQSRRGFKKFSTGYNSTGHLQSRVMGIFENINTQTNEKELLAFDKNYLYVYNESSNGFDLVPFAGSLAAFAGFNLSSNDFYISGTSYPKKDGSQRFVFTGKGMPGVYFYDGTDVRDFTNAADNPDYQAFAAGSLDKAYHVIWFGERLNFIAPTINSTFYPVGMLYSAIRDSSGNGDKFNSPGSGLLQLDSYDYINGASVLGDRIILNNNSSNWSIEKTRDAFNPYISRKIPSVIGTDASFSMVSWNDEVESLGKTGVISTDGRRSLRVDNKIPYFTADEIDPLELQQIYGGFNRETSQFMWAYVDGSLGSSTQDKVLLKNYEETTWSVNDERFSCFGETVKGQNLTWDGIDETQNPEWETWDTTEEIWDKIGLGAETIKTLAGDDLGFIYELNQDFEDYNVAVSGITPASNAVISTDDHAFIAGDTVILENVEGMTEINGIESLVLSTTSNSITVNVDSTNFTTYTSGGTASKPIDFYVELSPFNPYRSIGRKCRVSHIEFLLNSDAGDAYVDLYQDGESSPFKSNVLITPSSTQKEGEWVSVEVNNVMDFFTLSIRHKSISSQFIDTSVRIHCEMYGMTTV